MARKHVRGLYKRGSIWWMCYTANGRTIRESTNKTNVREAEGVLDKTKHAIRTGEYVPEAERKVTLPRPWEIVLDSYLEDRERRGKRLDSYRKLADWREAFKGWDLVSVTLEDVERQLAAWMNEREWSPATFNNALSQVSGVFSHAYRRGWIDRHPVRGRAERLPVAEGRKIPWRRQHVETLLGAAVEVAKEKTEHAPADWLRNVILGACFTGLRKGVFCALRVRDVERDSAGALWFFVGKDKNGRPVHKRFCGETADVVGRRIANATPEAYLFPGPRGGNAYTSLERHLRLAVAKAAEEHPELTGATFHGFRKAFATILFNERTDPEVVRELGNWRTRTIMERHYAAMADERLREAEERLGNILTFAPLAGGQLHTTSQSAEVGRDTLEAVGESA